MQSRDKSFSVIGYSISTEYKAPAFSASSMFLYWALNNLSRLCDSIAEAVGVPGGVKYQFVSQPEAHETSF
ncbi:hypothetical protein [Escherichia coli]|uniref:hypothetical protein n=1 Tax=Escherichia coli TaxID=562 RepID=UPI00293BDFD4|nr:hypothetical protein [Escherichia coli]